MSRQSPLHVRPRDIVDAFVSKKNILLVYTKMYKEYGELTPKIHHVAGQMEQFIQTKIKNVRPAWFNRPRELMARLNVYFIDSMKMETSFSTPIVDSDDSTGYSSKIDLDSDTDSDPDTEQEPNPEPNLPVVSTPVPNQIVNQRQGSFEFTLNSTVRDKDLFPYTNEYTLTVPWTDILRSITNGKDIALVEIALESIYISDYPYFLSPFCNSIQWSEDMGAAPMRLHVPFDSIHSCSQLYHWLSTEMSEKSTRYKYIVENQNGHTKIRQIPPGTFTLDCTVKNNIGPILGFESRKYTDCSDYISDHPFRPFTIPDTIKLRIKEWKLDLNVSTETVQSRFLTFENVFAKVRTCPSWKKVVEPTYKTVSITLSTTGPQFEPVHIEHKLVFKGHVIFDCEKPKPAPRKRLQPVPI